MIHYFNCVKDLKKFNNASTCKKAEIAAMEYENETTGKSCEIILIPDKTNDCFVFTYGESDNGIALLGVPSTLTTEKIKELFEVICKEITSCEFPDYSQLEAIDPYDGIILPKYNANHWFNRCIKEFNCESDLSKYTDSMLFDSGECIASMSYFDETKNKGVEMYLMVCGNVNVQFKETYYFRASEFPDRLIKLIKTNPEWELDERVYINENNWFEFVYTFTDSNLSDGVLMEEDIYKMSVGELKADMANLCRNLLEK